MIPSDFGWSDLGTFGSLYTHIPKDNSENALVSKNVLLYNSSKNMIHSNSDKLIVIDGLEDYIIVDQKNVLLICKKENEQMIKQYTKDVKEKKEKITFNINYIMRVELNEPCRKLITLLKYLRTKKIF